MIKTPLEIALDYANGDVVKQTAFEDGFVAGISYEVENRAKKIMEEPDWRQRVINERTNLEHKIQKLNKFLNEINGSLFDSRVSGDELRRLMEQ